MAIRESFVTKNLNTYVVFTHSTFGWISRMSVLTGRSLVPFLKHPLESVPLLFVKFLLGTDKFGRDILSRLVLGVRVSLIIGFMAVCISVLIGILISNILDKILYISI